MIELGEEYFDRITGFKGLAIGHCRYLTGCHQTLLAPPVKDSGDFTESHWFDDQRLEKTGKRCIVINNGSTPGCDKQAPRK